MMISRNGGHGPPRGCPYGNHHCVRAPPFLVGSARARTMRSRVLHDSGSKLGARPRTSPFTLPFGELTTGTADSFSQLVIKGLKTTRVVRCVLSEGRNRQNELILVVSDSNPLITTCNRPLWDKICMAPTPCPNPMFDAHETHV